MKNATGRAGMTARGILAAALLACAATEARGALVTLFVPVPVKAVSALDAMPDESAAPACASVDAEVRDLETGTLDAQAQQWAYLISRPGFSLRALPRRPGADITHRDLRHIFFRHLALWTELEIVPQPSLETQRRVNDASVRIRFLLETCRA